MDTNPLNPGFDNFVRIEEKMARNRNNKKQNQLVLLPVDLPEMSLVINGKKLFADVLKIIDAELIADKKPSETISEALKELDAYQLHIFFSKMSCNRKNIELLKDVADVNICKDTHEKKEKLLTMTAKTPPAELVGRVFVTINHLTQNQQISWLTDFKNYLSLPLNYKNLMVLAVKIAFFTPAQAITYIKGLEYFFVNNKINEVLK